MTEVYLPWFMNFRVKDIFPLFLNKHIYTHKLPFSLSFVIHCYNSQPKNTLSLIPSNFCYIKTMSPRDFAFLLFFC